MNKIMESDSYMKHLLRGFYKNVASIKRGAIIIKDDKCLESELNSLIKE